MTTEEAVAYLHSICVREYARASQDPSPDRKVGRKAILEAERCLDAIPTSLACEAFLEAAEQSLEALRMRYSRDDVLDPDGWGSGAVGAVLNEVIALRGDRDS